MWVNWVSTRVTGLTVEQVQQLQATLSPES